MRSSLIVLVICGAFLSVQAHAEGPSRKPENLTMTLAWIADAKEPNQHLFVINGVVAYRSRQFQFAHRRRQFLAFDKRNRCIFGQ